jgi:hypothetical protein
MSFGMVLVTLFKIYFKMKKILNLSFLFLWAIVFLGCWERKSANCHYNIYVMNKSDKTIYSNYSRSYPDTSLKNTDMISIDNDKVVPNDSISISASSSWGGCWEKNFTSEQPLPMERVIIFIFDERTIKNISWDSIKVKKLYLRRYDLTLEDLQNRNWTITYP